jgi:hypothetical protein
VRFSSGTVWGFCLIPTRLRSPQNQDVIIRTLAFGVLLAGSLFGQKHFSWQNACFNNPTLPYCSGKEFGLKPGAKAKDGTVKGAGTNAAANGINWRFADPLADVLAGFNCSTITASPLARRLISQLGSDQGLSGKDIQKVLDGLSGVSYAALSARDDRAVFMIMRAGTDAVLPALEAGWKAVPVAGNALLIGQTEAVDQAVLRMVGGEPLSELAQLAEQQPGGSEFWAVGSGKLAGPEAVSAGVKRFMLMVSIQDHLSSDAAFEFSAPPDANARRQWASVLVGAVIDGNVAHVRTSIEADEVRERFGPIAASPLGQRLGGLVKAARFLPARDTKITGTRPVIQGLDGGPREVKQ